MKKAVFTVLAIIYVLTSSAFEECSNLNLGFVTIVSGTKWVDNGETFVFVNNPIEVPCSEGKRW